LTREWVAATDECTLLVDETNSLCHRLQRGLELESCEYEIVFAKARSFMRLGKYESSHDSHVGTAVTFLLIGMGAGALAALLLAPKSGKQLRRDLKRGYDDAKDAVGDWADEAKDRTREAGEKVRDFAKRGADLAEEIRDTAREKVEPLRRVINRD
jgi:gas vesicle protein